MNNRSIIMGLTGPTGAGKSTVARELQKLGCAIIDCDLVAREVTSQCAPCMVELKREYGGDILENGVLNRHLLAQRAFTNEEKASRLNQITHPWILKRVDEIVQEFCFAKRSIIIIDAPLLFESGADRSCDVILAVTAPLEIRLNRIIIRDGITEDFALKRIHAQHDNSYYLERSDYQIDGSAEIEQISDQIKKIILSLEKNEGFTTVVP